MLIASDELQDRNETVYRHHMPRCNELTVIGACVVSAANQRWNRKCSAGSFECFGDYQRWQRRNSWTLHCSADTIPFSRSSPSASPRREVWWGSVSWMDRACTFPAAVTQLHQSPSETSAQGETTWLGLPVHACCLVLVEGEECASVRESCIYNTGAPQAGIHGFGSRPALGVY